MAHVEPPTQVLITGVNGYLGAWSVRKFLESGYSVRGTVRSVAKSGQYLKDLFASYGDNFDIVEVADIGAPGAFDEAVKGIQIVAHTASPFSSSSTDVDANIKPAVGGVTSLLESVISYGNDVKRVIIFSSVAAIAVDQDPWSTSTWNDSAINTVKEKGSEAGATAIYFASKALAERAAWDFVEKHKPSWDLVSLNPAWLFGPGINDVTSVSHLSASLQKFYELIVSDTTRSSDRLQSEWGGVNDVRDLAQLTVDAAKVPSAGGGRYLTVQDVCYDQQLVDISNSLSLVSTTLTKGVPRSCDGKAPPVKTDTKKVEEVFGFKSTPVETMIRDTILYFKEKGFVQ